MLSKKLILMSVVTVSILTGCTSVLNNIAAAMTDTPKTDSVPEKFQSGNYFINSYLNYSMAENYTIDDYIKVWGKPVETYTPSGSYIAKWQLLDDKSCTVYVNFNPKTKVVKPLDYRLDDCLSVSMTGPVITVPKDEPYNAGYMAMRSRTLNDVMADWLGKNIDSALVKWGAPASSTAMNSGGKIYTWKNYWESARDVWSGNYTYGWCEQTLVSNSKGVIVNWNHKGCRSGATYGQIPKLVAEPKPLAM
ncbi:hypothetical protein [Zophobihabitans entericus]|uniref:Lipoprotein n=1 Tax=Zophobihabitans entericus TaxID=1635327 RepID=A0A6G9IBZ7_9GAMM|nr:hypothetical protein [Zophobihabitans entericus]QIQ21357.1 hypothetical protein IPMB12_06435 [Zophobihabitans entericus]